MFIKSKTDSMLDAEIQSLLEKLADTDKDSNDYDTVVERLSKLTKLKPESRAKPLSADTILVVAANVFGILWLARYERENVIKSKNALNMVMKPR